MGRTLVALAVAAVACAPLCTSARAADRVHLPYTKTKLPNGLEVIIHENHRSPIVTVNVMYHVGARDDPQGRRGFAHLFEHVMFAGSKHVPPGAFFSLLDSAGATDMNGETDPDWTTYHETVPANQLELALWLESDRMGFLLPGLDQARFDNARQVVARERQQRVLNEPCGQVSEMIMRALFPPQHPYHVLGLPESLDAATLDEARAFFDAFYAPNNATIVLSGDLDKTQALALVDKYFGPIPAGHTPPQHAASSERVEMPSHMEVEANVPTPHVYLTWITPAFLDPGDAELDLIATMLKDLVNAHLNALVALGIASETEAVQASMERGSVFQVAVTAAPGKTADDVLHGLDTYLQAFLIVGPTDEEMQRARWHVAVKELFRLEKDSARAFMMNRYNQLKGEPDYVGKAIALHEDVTGESLRQMLFRLGAPRSRLVTVVTPNPGAPRAGRLVSVSR